MKSAKVKPKETTEARQNRDKRDYQRLVADIKHHLEHRSPGIWDWIDEAAEKVKDTTSKAWDTVTTTVKETTKKTGDWLDDAWQKTTSWVSGLTSNVKHAVDDVVSKADEWVSDKWQTVSGWVSQGIGAAKDWLDEVMSKTSAIIGDATDKAKDIVDDADEKTRDAVRKVTETVTAAAAGAYGAAGGFINMAEITLGIGMEAAWAALATLPVLFSNWRDELAAWFDFDIEKFIPMLAEAQSKLREAEK